MAHVEPKPALWAATHCTQPSAPRNSPGPAACLGYPAAAAGSRSPPPLRQQCRRSAEGCCDRAGGWGRHDVCWAGWARRRYRQVLASQHQATRQHLQCAPRTAGLSNAYQACIQAADQQHQQHRQHGNPAEATQRSYSCRWVPRGREASTLCSCSSRRRHRSVTAALISAASMPPLAAYVWGERGGQRQWRAGPHASERRREGMRGSPAAWLPPCPSSLTSHRATVPPSSEAAMAAAVVAARVAAAEAPRLAPPLLLPPPLPLATSRPALTGAAHSERSQGRPELFETRSSPAGASWNSVEHGTHSPANPRPPAASRCTSTQRARARPACSMSLLPLFFGQKPCCSYARL